MRLLQNFLIIFLTTFFGFLVISGQTIAFKNVNVIPMNKEQVLPNHTVLIKDGIIVEIGSKVNVPKDAQIIDGTGKYLIPGLIDMHVHMLSDDAEYPKNIAEDELKIMVANGVTTVRFMIGTPEQLVLREKSAKSEIIAPTIYAASPHLTGREQGNDFVVNTPDEAREAVRKSKAAGYDFIKVTTYIKPEVYEAAVDEAAKQNIRVVGHADSRFVGLERALKAKQQIEHLDGYLEALLKEDAPMKGSVSDIYIYQPKNWESIDYVDENKIPIIAKRTVESNPFVDPTQSFMKNTFGLFRSEESIRAQPDFKFYPKKNQDFYINYMKRTPLNQVSWEKRARWVEIKNKMIKAIYDAGGKIMVGSDTPEFLWLYGFTEHREMKALNDAGLSTYAVLEAATKNPSEYLGTLDKTGTIEKGKRADLVLLNANPLENISATENRAGVMLKGKYYTQAEMNKWLDEAAPKLHNSLKEDETKNNNLEGFWQGAVTIANKFWRVNFTVKKDGENYKAVADFLDADGYGREFSVSQNGENFRLERGQPNANPIVFEGKVEGDSFKGNWSGVGIKAAFDFLRFSIPKPSYKEEEVTFKNGDVTLSGTLLLPNRQTPGPVVVFTHGGGAETRLPNKSWALHFVRRGFAALIYDKRGTGKSTGSWQTSSMEDLADDALAGINFLKTRTDIDLKKITVAGHSQGGWIAPLTATKSNDVSFVITSAASGISPDKQSIFHRANVMREEGFSEDAVKIATDLREKLYATGKMLLNNDPNAAAERKKVSAELEKYAKEPWLDAAALPPNLDEDKPSRGALELLFFQPVPMWEKVKVPVFLVWGDKDTVVPVVEGRKIIEDTLSKNGNKDYSVKIFPNVDHGVVIVNPKKNSDFPRVPLDYYESMVDWLVAQVAKNK
ncbi:MAG: alpha/beta fold hydrolase [Pyrinomonadaceae bacterium]|nr:alpha/beta fold hydrolase [Pyrinomonadaceae bacterium]